ncbi:MAG: hypothetical protein SFT68_03310, partial [Rickettsiaceae bacterium]|nr:hypothetical protein [Rickettsiaceae bacterium]
LASQNQKLQTTRNAISKITKTINTTPNQTSAVHQINNSNPLKPASRLHSRKKNCQSRESHV